MKVDAGGSLSVHVANQVASGKPSPGLLAAVEAAHGDQVLRGVLVQYVLLGFGRMDARVDGRMHARVDGRVDFDGRTGGL